MASIKRPRFLSLRVITSPRHDDLPAPTEKEKQEYLRSLEARGYGKNGREYYLYQRREDALFARQIKVSQTRVGARRGAGSPTARAGRAAHAQARSGGEGGDSGGDGGGDPEPDPALPATSSLKLNRADAAARWLAKHNPQTEKPCDALAYEVAQENRVARQQARCVPLVYETSGERDASLDVAQAQPWSLPSRPVCGLSPRRWQQLAPLAETKSERAVAPLLAEGARVIEIAERLHRTRRRIEQVAASLRRRAVELAQRIEARRGKPPLALKKVEPAHHGSLPLPARTVERAPEQLVLFGEAA